jgi:hypothetical protein
MMGVCPECDKLVSIAPRGMHLISRKGNVYSDRMREYYPTTHDKPDGTKCEGHKKAII